jgi:hypothetical protein
MTSVALVLAYTVAVGFGLFGVMALSRAITQAVDRRWSTVLITALVVWYGLTTALGVTDVFRADSPQNARFPMLGLGLAAPLLCLLASTWLAPPLSALIRSPRSVTASLIEVHSSRCQQASGTYSSASPRHGSPLASGPVDLAQASSGTSWASQTW